MKTSIVWLRQDLRLTDNPALHHASQHSDVVIPAYIHAPDEAAPWQPGSASNWWRHHSLVSLDDSLRANNSGLTIRRGPSVAALSALIAETGASAVYWNKLYEPALLKRDDQVRRILRQLGIDLYEYDGSLLYPPGTVLNKEQQAYRVFTPFWKACQKLGFGDLPLPVPQNLSSPRLASVPVHELDLLPKIPWDHGLKKHWQPGESSAQQQLMRFCDTTLQDYDSGRDIPGRSGTSQLSPHLAFGEISPRQIVTAALNTFVTNSSVGTSIGTDTFIQELGWREFSYHTMYHFPHICDQPLNPRFDDFPWHHDEQLLCAWRRGNTGFPIVDAGMRQLWHSGWMHNRVRMIVASFLTKNGLISWQQGAHWFWDTLVDADLASNSFNWQWVAGCGADAAPYFRIFNPLRQSEKFDPDARYLRHWLPELANLPTRWLHTPWLAPQLTQLEYGVRIGVDYPAPILDLSQSRNRALQLFGELPKAAAGTNR